MMVPKSNSVWSRLLRSDHSRWNGWDRRSASGVRSPPSLAFTLHPPRTPRRAPYPVCSRRSDPTERKGLIIETSAACHARSDSTTLIAAAARFTSKLSSRLTNLTEVASPAGRDLREMDPEMEREGKDENDKEKHNALLPTPTADATPPDMIPEHMYKQLSDQTAGVHNLLAVSVVEDVEEKESLNLEEAGSAQRRDAGGYIARKARGEEKGSDDEKGTCTQGQHDKGSMEALVYALVFTAVFLRADAARREVNAPASILRCPAYLVCGASWEEVEGQCARVARMAGEYLPFHSAPADATAWEDFRADTLFFPARHAATNGISARASTGAMCTPTPR
ncbi:hypothetical protein B0H14DRAFT_3164076 [Mycena olivaceomarginata]|nr:hypothetical protein B0H14DRAFT_3164076 [Mycena olivaceomarginata]